MQVSMEQAYREACLALGEATVRERLLTAELARHDAREAEQSASPPSPVDGG